MNTSVITTEQMKAYGAYLQREERSSGTIEKYLRDIRGFFSVVR